MQQTRYYQVAGHIFGVTAEEDIFGLMTNYEPFATQNGESFSQVGTKEPIRDCALMLLLDPNKPAHPDSYTEEMRQDDGEQVIVCGRTADGKSVYEFQWLGETAGWLVCSDDYREGRLFMTGRHTKMAVDNALMVQFAMATAGQGTVLFHAAVVSHRGRGYMFLGKSGTGKSTHARLWLNYIEGTELVNDDNPVVRDGVVYGSPWSGKTPCYRNVSYPLGGIVMLSQAPYNKIRRLGGIEAYASIVASISGQRWDRRIADGLHATENALATHVPVWHLACLPDEAAARVCFAGISS